MKVVQLLTQATGGPCDHAVEVAVQLDRRGHDVVVVVADGPAAARVEAAGLRRVGLGPASKGDLRGAAQLVTTLRRERPDVVHCQDRRAGLLGRATARSRRGRTVYTLHGVPDSLSGLVRGNLQVSPTRRFDHLRYLRAERALAAVGGGAVIVPSAALADYAIRRVGVPARQVRIVPNGVDLERFSPHPRDRQRELSVLWLGALVPTKRVDVLLRAVSQVPRVRVRIAGAGELEPELRRLAADLGVEARIDWLGWVADPAPLFAAADVVALPSAAENLPLAVLQGMACGLPCVATTVGGIPEAVTDGVDGLLVEPGAVAPLAAALALLRDDPALSQRLGAAARRTAAARFDVVKTVDQLVEAYV